MNPPVDNDNIEVAPDGAASNWSYTLDEDAGTITLNQYTGSEIDVTIYGKYLVNGKVYNTKIGSNPNASNYSPYMFNGSGYGSTNTNCKNIQTITFKEGVDTSECTNMSFMFYNCQSLNLINFTSTIVTTMKQMSYEDSKLPLLDTSNFDTSNVTNMYGIFYNCTSLTQINGLEYFNTSKVTDMDDMFEYCTSLIELDLRSFDTSNVTSMYKMFSYCLKLTTINGLENLDTSNVTDMDDMFEYCTSLTSLDLSNWDTSKVTTMTDMFNSCTSLTNIIGLENFDVSNVTDMTNIFYKCLCFNDIKDIILKWNIDKEHLVADENLAMLLGCNCDDFAEED